MIRKTVAGFLIAVSALFLAGCNENVPGDPDYYSCQYFGTHCDK
jgi:hypothetical protein